MTDELTTMLAKDSTLRIVSCTSAKQFKDAHRSLPEIARALNVDAILEGPISRSSNQVHMTLQLVRGDTESHLWAESYIRDTNDVAALPDEAARAIAARLNSSMPPHANARYIKPDAYDAYLRGHYSWVVGRDEDAGRYFQRAVDIQPDYALGWTGLADYYAMGALDGVLDPLRVLPQAEAAARKAVELDDSLPRAHAVFGGMIFSTGGIGSRRSRNLPAPRNWTLTMPRVSACTRRFSAHWVATTKRSRCCRPHDFERLRRPRVYQVNFVQFDLRDG
jgi:tetratricopeptide (TPR) repeat protein